jgi:hypothetical protein
MITPFGRIISRYRRIGGTRLSSCRGSSGTGRRNPGERKRQLLLLLTFQDPEPDNPLHQIVRNRLS